MAPHMADSQRNLVHDMIVGSSHTANEIANVAGCSARSVKSIRSNIRTFGTAKAPWNGGGGPRSITPPMLEALREHLFEKPDQYLNEMVVFLWDEFGVLLTVSTISRTLKSIKWSKKQCRRVAKGRNADLRDYYLHNL